MKKVFIVLVCLFFVCGCNKDTIKSGKINCEQMDKIMERDNAKLIDVRTKDEFEQGHLQGADNIPAERIMQELLYVDKKTSIIVYCASGTRSAKAFDILKGAGYENIYDLGAMSKCQK